jgi:hypothetical protein
MDTPGQDTIYSHMGTGPTTRYFSGASIISLGAGVVLFCLSLFSRRFDAADRGNILFGIAMLFAGLANGLAFLVLHRMALAGYEVGLWRWPQKDFKLYLEYWRIAPLRGWSRWVLAGAVLCFAFGGLFLFSIPLVSANVLK